MAYKVIILYRLYMPSYFLGTFTEYPCLDQVQKIFSRMFFCFDKEHSGLGYTTYKRGETD